MQVYFDHQKNKQAKSCRIKRYFVFLSLGLLVVLITYAVIYSPLFKVREFKISGADRISDDSVLGLLQPLILNSRFRNFLGLENLLVWGRDDMDISKTSFTELHINRDWRRQSVIINIKERAQFAIWCGINDCYWIDENGTAFAEAPQTEGSLILTIYDNEQKIITKGDRVIEDRYVQNLIDILKSVLEMRFAVEKISFNRTLQEINIENYQNPKLLFSTRFNPELNLVALRSLKEKVGLKGMKYIDLRVENRLYYKN